MRREGYVGKRVIGLDVQGKIRLKQRDCRVRKTGLFEGDWLVTWANVGKDVDDEDKMLFSQPMLTCDCFSEAFNCNAKLFCKGICKFTRFCIDIVLHF